MGALRTGLAQVGSTPEAKERAEGRRGNPASYKLSASRIIGVVSRFTDSC